MKDWLQIIILAVIGAAVIAFIGTAAKGFRNFDTAFLAGITALPVLTATMIACIFGGGFIGAKIQNERGFDSTPGMIIGGLAGLFIFAPITLSLAFKIVGIK
jgi:hypothetical protein